MFADILTKQGGGWVWNFRTPLSLIASFIWNFSEKHGIPLGRLAPKIKDLDLGKWKPTPNNINSLPEKIRNYISELETTCDLAGIIRENIILRDIVKSLEIELEEDDTI